MSAGDMLFIFCIQWSTAIVVLFCGLISCWSLRVGEKELKNEDDLYKMGSILQYPRKIYK